LHSFYNPIAKLDQLKRWKKNKFNGFENFFKLENLKKLFKD
jgi:hypothetical protein